MKRIAVLLVLGVVVAAALFAATSIKSAGDIEASAFIGDGSQLTNVDAPGTTLDTRLDNAETLLLMVQDQVAQAPLYRVIGPAMTARTGQTTSYEPDDDGDLTPGVAWPNPRFVANGDGTVDDQLTGLVWLADADCFGLEVWAMAFSEVASLANGACGLSDGSVAGDWRLPSLRELHSLVHFGFASPALPDTLGTGKCDGVTPCAFQNVVVQSYWSSTTFANATASAWNISMFNGIANVGGKTTTRRVWPLRD